MEYKLLDISDRTISFNFSNKIDQKINSKIVELSYEINRILDQLNIVSCYPTYNSLIVDYDPLNIERDKLRKEISEIIEKILSPLRFTKINIQAVSLCVIIFIRFTPIVLERHKILHLAYKCRSGKRPSWQIILPLILTVMDDADHVAQSLRSRSNLKV